VYRFLLTTRWLGFAALMLALAAAMVGLGFWQLSRYHERSSVNARIDAALRAEPVPVGQVLPVGVAPTAGAAWTRVRATGRFDAAHQVLARDRSSDSGGVSYWVGQIGHGATFEQVELSFIGSPEYFQLHGGTNKGAVDALYKDVLGLEEVRRHKSPRPGQRAADRGGCV